MFIYFNYYPLITYVEYTQDKSVPWKKISSAINKIQIHSLFPLTQQNWNINFSFLKILNYQKNKGIKSYSFFIYQVWDQAMWKTWNLQHYLPMFSNSSKHWNTILFCFNDRRYHMSSPDIYCICLQSLFLISLKPWAVKYSIHLLWTCTAVQQGKTSFNWIGEGKRKRKGLLKVGLFR